MSWQNLLMPYMINNQGTYQPAHPHSLTSAYVVRILDNIIPPSPPPPEDRFSWDMAQNFARIEESTWHKWYITVSDIWKIAVIILKFEQCSSTIQ